MPPRLDPIRASTLNVAILSRMDGPMFRPRSGGSLASLWAPVVGWAALIFIFSAQPDLRFAQEPFLDFVVRKIGHMAVFGILALLSSRAVAGTTSLRWPWAWALAMTVLYAVGDELHQGLVAGRHAAAADVGFDAAGALLALLIARRVRARRS